MTFSRPSKGVKPENIRSLELSVLGRTGCLEHLISLTSGLIRKRMLLRSQAVVAKLFTAAIGDIQHHTLE